MTSSRPGRGIRGAKGGRPKEAKDTLRSTQRGEIVDLLGEGAIGGLVNGLKSVYLDGVPVENADGSRNFEEFSLALTRGGPTDEAQDAHNFGEVQTEVAVGLNVLAAVPVVRAIADPEVDAVRVTIAVPALQRTKGNGDVVGAEFDWAIDVQSAGGGYVQVYAGTVSGKASSAYQRAVRVDLKATGPAPWSIRVRRLSADSVDSGTVNGFAWSSYTAISGVRMLYRNSAVARLGFNAEYFSSIPTRAYDLMGVSDWDIPSNYDPHARTVTGTWDGTYVQDWTNNPAWVLYNLAKHPRYGLGNYLPALPDKWELYALQQWCDGQVPDGRGGFEPRYTIDTQLMTQGEALTLLQEICAIFRGALLYGAGALGASWDAPGEMTDIWTPANVVDGLFHYSDGSWAAKKSSCTCWFNDRSQLGKRVPVTWDDPDLVAKYGMRRMELHPLGCSRASQAMRMARWALYTTEYEDASVSFRVGAQGRAVRIGAICGISDPSETGERLAGRVSAATTTQVTLDAPVTLAPGETYKLWVTLQDPDDATRLKAEERTVTSAAGTHQVLTLASAYTAAPVPETTWLLEGTDVAPTLWRYIAVEEVQGENGKVEYDITCLRHEPGKWDLIEQDRPLEARPTRRLSDAAPKLTTLDVEELVYVEAGQPISRAVISWGYPAPGLRYVVSWRHDLGAWNEMAPTSTNTVSVAGLSPGLFEVRVWSLNGLGNLSAPAQAARTLFGDIAGPAEASGLGYEVVIGGMNVWWTEPDEADYEYTELRQGATWLAGAELYKGRGNSITWYPPANGDYQLWVVHYDRAGNPSDPVGLETTYEAMGGTPGGNNATPTLYQRSNSLVPPAVPSTSIEYTFSTGAFSGTLGLWSAGIPSASGGRYLYVTRAHAFATTETFDIPPGGWSTAAILVQDGQEGDPGDAGTSVAELMVYRRAASAPAAPTGGSFNFTTQVLTAPALWSVGIPAGADPVYAARGIAATATPGSTVTPSWGAAALTFTDGQAVDAIFRRSATQPATPSASAGVPSGWYSNVADVPASSSPMWSSFGRRASPSASWVWLTPVRVEGQDGAPGDPGDAGADGTQVATAYLYQWSAATPANPSGGSTFTWASGAHGSYTGGGSWSVSVPANPGTPGVQLWLCSKAVSAPASATSSAVSWASGYSKYAVSGNGLPGDPGDPGTPGVQVAQPTLWRWALSIPTISGSNDYTWATGAITGTLPAGWSLTPGSGSPGQTLWAAARGVVGAAGDVSASIDWTSASITARGYAGADGADGADGSDGATGQTGISARRAYTLTTLTSLGSGTVTSTGISSLPAAGSFGAGTWTASPSTPTAGQVLYQSDGLYNPATNTTTWETPYISALKVGQLSALAVNTGDLTVNGQVTTTGDLFSSGFTSGSAGWRIRGNGSAEFNNVVARGGLYTNYGEIGGAVVTTTYVQSADYVPNTAGWRLSNGDGTLYANSALLRNADASRVFNLNATGTQAVLTAPGIQILANGSATFSGALSAATGTFGALTVAAGGNIKSGQTAYNTGTGFWLGLDGATPKFSIGNSAGNRVTWDGSALTVVGATVSGGTITNPDLTLTGISAAISGGGSSSVAAGGTAARTVTIGTPSGGKAPYTYKWSSIVQDQYGTVSRVQVTGSTGTSCPCSMTSTGSGFVSLDVSCVVTDANGLTKTATTSVNLTVGSPIAP